MKKLVLQRGNSYEVHDKESVVFHESLPPGTYIVCYNQGGECYYLDRIEDFVLPDKLYGSVLKDARRVLSTFKARPLSTGVLLQGMKGSGKTLLAKVISWQIGLQEGIPTLSNKSTLGR